MKLEVYEDNGGGLYLCILNNRGNPISIFENWEYEDRGELKNAMEMLIENHFAFTAWDCDLCDRLLNDWRYSYQGTMIDIYDEISGNKLIAEFDGDKIITYPENMGAAGHWSLDEPEL